MKKDISKGFRTTSEGDEKLNKIMNLFELNQSDTINKLIDDTIKGESFSVELEICPLRVNLENGYFCAQKPVKPQKLGDGSKKDADTLCEKCQYMRVRALSTLVTRALELIEALDLSQVMKALSSPQVMKALSSLVMRVRALELIKALELPQNMRVRALELIEALEPMKALELIEALGPWSPSLIMRALEPIPDHEGPEPSPGHEGLGLPGHEAESPEALPDLNKMEKKSL